ncbi:MAG: nickel pincer cofactor biosynthesis protein LarC [Pseudomonadales bacterium]
MTQALYYDCFCGISGDMHIGAMLDLGVPQAWLREQLQRLPNHDEFTLEVVADKRKGIAGTRASVHLSATAAKPHRHLRHIAEIIAAANYPTAVEALALNIFTRLAEAEAAVHDSTIEAVHFHEVGATDAIVDITAAALCIDYLQPERVYCGPIEVGSGTVRCDHGLMPVPAPATAALLTGAPCHYGRVDGEATTPTGAAILAAVVTDFTLPPTFTTTQIGLGVGQKDFSVANILRVQQGTVTAAVSDSHAHYLQEHNLELQCNIDDLSPEASEPLLTALWAAGALDVHVAAITMKKQRPGFKLTVLLHHEQRDAILGALFEHSTAIGARTRNVQKWMLPRASHSVPCSLGPVRIKIVTLADGNQRFKLEHDDVMACTTTTRGYLRTRAQLESEVQQWFNNHQNQDPLP